MIRGYRSTGDFLSRLERQKIALAALEAKTDDRIVDDGYDQYMGGVQVSNSLNCAWPLGKVFYGAPPVPVMKPISPPSTECRGWVKEAIQEHDEKWKAAIRAAGHEIKGGEL